MILQDTSDSPLGKAALPMVQAHPGKSGVFALADGRDAFAARVLLADASECSLDVQYYIWNGDKTGTLLFEALRRAADRGVRVRLLLDDNNTAGLDTVLAALNSHPKIEVRLFNPFMHRRWRVLSFLTDFRRLNRRMHNKSFIADRQACIIGGRNVGDEYFDAGQGVSKRNGQGHDQGQHDADQAGEGVGDIAGQQRQARAGQAFDGADHLQDAQAIRASANGAPHAVGKDVAAPGDPHLCRQDPAA